MKLWMSELVDILQHMTLYHPGLRIFPRLQQLYWTSLSFAALPHIHMFLQSSLTTLTLHYESDQQSIGQELANVFHSICHECYDLQSLKLYRNNGHGSSMAAEAIGMALSEISHLRVFLLAADTLSAGGLGHLAGLASLSEVDIVWPSIQDSQRAALAQVCEHDRPFPALEILELFLDLSDVEPSERNDTMLPELLGVIAGPLVELLISAYSVTREVVEMLGTQLARARNTLRQFHLNCGTDIVQQADDQVAHWQFQLDIHALRPLCALRNLVDVRLVTPHLDVDSSGLRELIRAWPLLERFDFYPTCMNYISGPLDAQGPCPSFGIGDLSFIAERCPRLEHWALPLYISAASLDAHIPFTHPQQRLRSLDLFSSLVPDGRAGCFASYLSATFPALRHICLMNPPLRGSTSIDIAAQIDEVNRLIRKAAAVCDKERKV
jgi:hypothetical protein